MPFDPNKADKAFGTQAQGNFAAAEGVPPDQAAQAIQNEDAYGIPADGAYRAPVGMADVADTPTISSPAVASWAQSPARAAAVSDSVPAVQKIFDTVQSLGNLGLISPLMQFGGKKGEAGAPAPKYGLVKSAIFGVQQTMQMTRDQVLGAISPLAGNIASKLFNPVENRMLGYHGMPRDPGERAAFLLGGAAPIALFPGSAAQRAVQVALPFLGSEAGGALGRAVGGDTGEDIGTIAGGLAGGGAASYRFARRLADVHEQIISSETLHEPNRLTGPPEEVAAEEVPTVFEDPPTPGTDAHVDTLYAEQAEQRANALEEVEAAVAESPTHGRGLTEDLVEHVAPEQTVSVPIRALEDAAIADPELNEHLSLPEHSAFTAAESEAYGSGHPTVDVPMSTYLKTFAGTKWADELRPHISINNAPSVEEMKTHGAKVPKKIETDQELSDLWETPEGQPLVQEFLDAADYAMGNYPDTQSMIEKAKALEVNGTSNYKEQLMLNKWNAIHEHLNPMPKETASIPDYDEDVAAAMGVTPGDFWAHQTGKDFPEPEDLWEGDEDLDSDQIAELKKARPVVKAAAKRAVQDMFLGRLFTDAKSAGMSEQQFALYSDQVAKAFEDAAKELWQRTFNKVKKQYSKEWKTAYDGHFPLVTQHILSQPVMRAQHALRAPLSLKTEFNDIMQDNAFVHDGQPITFYHASTHSNVGTPHNPWKQQSYAVISFSTDPKFVNAWASSWGGGDNYDPNYVHYAYDQNKSPTHYITYLHAKNPADFRKPADVEKALAWHLENNPNLNAAETRTRLQHGDWQFWERPEMWKAVGWDGTYMKEHKDSALNASVANPNQIFFKYVDRGGNMTPSYKLSPETKKLYPAKLWEKLPHTMFSVEHGLLPDDIAADFDYASGADLLGELTASEHMRGDVPFRKFVMDSIRAETRARTVADVGDLLAPDRILDDAKALFTEPHITELLEGELRTLAQNVGSPLKLDDVKAKALEQFDALPLKQAVKVRKFEATLVTKRKEIVALLKSKPMEAFRAHVNSMMQHYKLIAAHEMVGQVARAQKKWSGLSKQVTIRGMDQEYLDRIHQVLGALNYTLKRNVADLNASLGTGFHEWMAEQIAQGEPLIPAYIPAPGETMTVAMFKGLDAMLDNLAHRGRELGKAQIEGKRVELDNLIADIGGNFDKIGRGNNVATLRDPGPSGIAGRAWRGANSWMIQPERLLEAADGDVLDGPLVASVDRPMQKAMVWKQDKLKALGKELEAFMKTQPEGWHKTISQKINSGLEFDGLPLVETKGELLRLMMNLGNAGNKEKLLRGYNLTEEQLAPVLKQHATKADWDFVQQIWDMHEGMWPDIERVYKTLYGVAPFKVKNTPVSTEFGEYKGGYFPVTYDWLQAEKLGMPVPRHISDDNPFGREFVSAFPANPYSKGRTNFYAPVQLNFDTVLGGMNGTVHDLAFREALLQAHKILTHPVVKKGFIESFGPEYLKQLHSWLQYVAHESLMDEGHAGWVANFLNKARVNVSNVGLMYRFSVVALHGPMAFISTLAEADKLGFLAANKDLYLSPAAFRLHDFITENSGEIRHRMRNQDRDINDGIRDLVLKQGFLTEFQKYGYHALGWSDQFSARSAWLYYYRKMQGELVPHEEAAQRADQFVRQVHGSGSPVNLAGVQRGGLGPHGAIGKFATMFTGFLNHSYNRNWRYGRLARRAITESHDGNWQGARRDFSKVMSYFLLSMVGGAAWYALEKGTLQGQKTVKGPKGFVAGMLHNLVGGMPLANSIIDIAEHKESDSMIMAPITALFGKAHRPGTLDDVAHVLTGHPDKVSPRWVQHAMETTGYFTGLGLGGPGLTAQYLADLGTGKEHVGSFADFAHGMLFGPKPSDKKGDHNIKVNVKVKIKL